MGRTITKYRACAQKVLGGTPQLKLGQDAGPQLNRVEKHHWSLSSIRYLGNNEIWCGVKGARHAHNHEAGKYEHMSFAAIKLNFVIIAIHPTQIRIAKSYTPTATRPVQKEPAYQSIPTTEGEHQGERGPDSTSARHNSTPATRLNFHSMD